MAAAEFFERASRLVARHRPHGADHAMIARLGHLHFFVGTTYHLHEQSPDIVRAVDGAPKRALDEMLARFSDLSPRQNGWTFNTTSMGTYGNFYLKRSAVAMFGLGANPAEDALYPSSDHDSDGQPLCGDNSYRLHFPAEELPPVRAYLVTDRLRRERLHNAQRTRSLRCWFTHGTSRQRRRFDHGAHRSSRTRRSARNELATHGLWLTQPVAASLRPDGSGLHPQLGTAQRSATRRGDAALVELDEGALKLADRLLGAQFVLDEGEADVTVTAVAKTDTR
jgi:hypothetical protein